MKLVLFLQPTQNRNGVLDRRLRDEDRLEAPGQSGIFFDIFPVFVERGRADAVQFAARQRGLQKVGRIHRAFGLSSADERVKLVDEQDDAAFCRGNLLQHGLQPLFEFAAIFRTCDERAHVKREKLLVAQAFGHVAVQDSDREPLGDGGLSDARLADQDRIVFRAPRQNLDGAANFLIPADHRVELALGGGIGKIASVPF